MKEDFFYGMCAEDKCTEDGEYYIEITVNRLLLFIPLCKKHFKIYEEFNINEDGFT